jgi:hypothetical protein
VLTTRHDLGVPEGTPGERDRHQAPVLLGLLPCPFARAGLESAEMRRCPGFTAEPLSFTGVGAGESLGVRESCRHLGTQRGPRGFVSACRHPGGRPAEAEALAGRPSRRRGVAAH